ncbi:MAG: hypothetical protein ACLQU1_16635 [Bryobacteraceae bacterium]
MLGDEQTSQTTSGPELISPDGKRFITLMPFEAAGQQRANNEVTFLLNFFDEVRQRTGVAKQ